MSSEIDSVFKIIFHNNDKLYEIYARDLINSNLFGFIEVEQIIFGEHSGLLVDPSEEKLKSEFGNVTRTYIPMHNVIRIDEVPKQGTAKIHSTGKTSNVKQFPGVISNFSDNKEPID